MDLGKALRSECSGVGILGGRNNVGKDTKLSKTFTSLPPHYRVMVKL